jgi:hypothetical protein
MNVKPILVIRFPNNAGIPYTKHMEQINSHELSKEYHVLFLKESNRDEVGFETLNVSDHDPIKMSQLEKLVLDSLTEEDYNN